MFPRDAAGADAAGAALVAAGFLLALLAGFACFGTEAGLAAVALFEGCFAVFFAAEFLVVFFATFLVVFALLAFFTTRVFVLTRFFVVRIRFTFRFFDFFLDFFADFFFAAVATTDSFIA
jgi:hypothetical protein